MWIKSWKELIEWVYNNSNACLFESNRSEIQQTEQKNELKKYYKNITTVRSQSLDDTIQKKRQLLLCLK